VIVVYKWYNSVMCNNNLKIIKVDLDTDIQAEIIMELSMI